MTAPTPEQRAELRRLRAALREIAGMDAGELADPRTGAHETALAALGDAP